MSATHVQRNNAGSRSTALPGPGYTATANTGSYIPASQRPDGTWRKPRRVKEGYIPQEEVPIYQSRGKIWAESRPKYPVGMSETMIAKLEAAQNQGVFLPSTQRADGTWRKERSIRPGYELWKPSVKKKKKKKAAGTNSNDDSSSDKPSTPLSKEVTDLTKKFKDTTIDIGKTSQPNPANRLRNLRKKLKEIEALELQIQNKELKNPDKDQLEKIKKKNDYEEELLQLMEDLKTT
ncbi:partner of Y14 and mago isoform X2 [Cimex lectularius]|uniref:Partner of Y14 and mago n=1 Tax=Cimex lectularius TaxID=79782 RepID=A0A8I6RAN3_CIMLE|nr:partner of Y14 and mago isoform X2 [Cimex lectularius]